MISPVIKYLVIAGYVNSQHDYDRHFITCKQLMGLYCVEERECVCIQSTEGHLSQILQKIQAMGIDLIELRPRYDGNYSIPRKAAK